MRIIGDFNADNLILDIQMHLFLIFINSVVRAFTVHFYFITRLMFMPQCVVVSYTDKLSSSVVNITVLRQLFPIFMIQAARSGDKYCASHHMSSCKRISEAERSTRLMSQVKTLAFIDHDR